MISAIKTSHVFYPLRLADWVHGNKRGEKSQGFFQIGVNIGGN
jgi:hypothetical protein